MRKLLISLIRCYQRYISVFLPPSCRFLPSCSQYTLMAIEEFGPIEGSYLGLKRVCRCHPFCHGGHDPLPQKLSKSNN